MAVDWFAADENWGGHVTVAAYVDAERSEDQ